MAIDLEQIASEQASDVAKRILTAARQGGTEADFRREAARILEEAGAAAQLQIIPRDEFSVARGRVDSVYNRLILEYKRPGVIKDSNSTRANQSVIDQVKNYILEVAKREKRESNRLAGVATDGFFYIFVRRVGEGWTVDDPVEVNRASTEVFLRLLFSLSSGAALIPENLVEDFGPRTIRAQRAVRALYRTLHACKHPLVEKLFEQWRLFFSEATDYAEWAERIEAKPEFRTFVKGMGLEPKYVEAPKVFFALHTYYALLIKLVASLAAARFAGGDVKRFSEFASKEGDELLEAFVDLERGGLFREYGIRNFLEGDFFGWYLAAWNDDIEKAIASLVQRLVDYDPGALELAPENARDLLKKLYHYLLPREIRHDLGEYYTPDWLAERLSIQTLGKADLGNPHKRVLDPACGSGTFLVILIKYIRDRAAKKGMRPDETLNLILQNVIGFDLNPLAVIAARTNFLLALGDLLKARTSDIDIPVYQSDSVMTPSQGNDLFDGQVYPLRTSVGEFRIPAVFAARGRMDVLANALDEGVESGVSVRAFLTRVSTEAGLDSDEQEACAQELSELHGRLKQLHDEGLNGVWARIIKNAFAPLFIEPCHYIVGNPPWVNWENLPDQYHQRSSSLWLHYGIRAVKGKNSTQFELGKQKRDISMLMTYVAADKYLHRGGKLGFVLSQSLFKTTGAGQGFRRFEMPDKTPFAPLIVEDMVELDPFEGATNRTVIAVFAKGYQCRYPVPYSYWRKRGKGRASTIGFDTPYEEVTNEKTAFSRLFAEPVDRNDKTSAWITAPRNALNVIRNVLGKAKYSAHSGCVGWLNGVYWMEVIGARPGGLLMVRNLSETGRKQVPTVQTTVENELIYPLLRGRDVNRWKPESAFSIVVPHDRGEWRAIPESDLQERYPKTWSYLKRFKTVLEARAGYRQMRSGHPFYTLVDVNEYTFSEWKVVWREQANSLVAAVVGIKDEKPVFPDHKLMMVALDSEEEAHYLCAALNSVPARFVVASYAVEIQMDTHILENVAVPRFSPESEIHQRLALLSKRAHSCAAQGEEAELGMLEAEVDRWAAKLWNLPDDAISEIKASLEDV